MIPRVEVIAYYPHSPYNIGEILSFIDHIENGSVFDLYSSITQDDVCIYAAEVDKSPAIFKKLKWWEHIKDTDLPQYLHGLNGRMFKLLPAEFDNRIFGHSDIEMELRIFWYSVKYLNINIIPATKDEYDVYVTKLFTNKK